MLNPIQSLVLSKQTWTLWSRWSLTDLMERIWYVSNSRVKSEQVAIRTIHRFALTWIQTHQSAFQERSTSNMTWYWSRIISRLDHDLCLGSSLWSRYSRTHIRDTSWVCFTSQMTCTCTKSTSDTPLGCDLPYEILPQPDFTKSTWFWSWPWNRCEYVSLRSPGS